MNIAVICSHYFRTMNCAVTSVTGQQVRFRFSIKMVEIRTLMLWCFHTRARQRQDNNKTNVEPVHFYDDLV